MASSSLYRRLRELFVFRWLQKLSSGTTVSPFLLDQEYIKSRAAHLEENEKIVVLMIDETYVASQVELVDGKLVGMTKDSKLAKTVLVFMIQSIRSKYRDVVKIIPVASLTTDFLLEQFHSVMEGLSNIFHVTAISTDNHVVNR